MRKRLSVLLTLSIIASALVVFAPTQQATAAALTVSWPQHSTNIEETEVVAHGDDDVTLVGCGANNSYVSQRFTGEEVSSNLPADENFSCVQTSSTVGPDGTVYGKYYDSAHPYVTYLTAVKSGRIKWKTDINFDSNCSFSTSRATEITSLSVGADGNVYLVAASLYSYYGCANNLVSINGSNGNIRFSVGLGNGSAHMVDPRAWTYADGTVIAVGPDGMQHTYDYDLTENTLAQYQFAGTVGEVFANADGRVFLVTPNKTVSSVCVVGLIYYHDLNGSDGHMDRNDGCYAPFLSMFTPTADGKLAASLGTTDIYIFDVPNNLSTYRSDPVPTGYNYSQTVLVSYSVDENGNALFVRQLRQSYPNSGKSLWVDYVDTTAVTSVYQRNGDGTPSDTPKSEGRRSDIYGGYLYLPVSYSRDTSSPYTEDVWTEKIDIGTAGFGTPSELKYGFSDGDELDYVALGDSFSSGEGNPDFMLGTNTNGCHRSKDKAYPILLATEPYIGSVDFVACSGATTDDVRGITESDDPIGKGGEPAQISALSANTDIVTLTIGGNDVGFVDYATACFFAICGASTSAYDDIIANIDSTDFQENVRDTYLAVLSAAPNAEVYVMNYPYIIVDDPEDDCSALLPGLTSNTEAVEMVTTHLNTTLLSIYLDIQGDTEVSSDAGRLHFVDVGSVFEDHQLCDEEPYFFSYILLEQEYSLHPNADGQRAFYDVLKGILN